MKKNELIEIIQKKALSRGTVELAGGKISDYYIDLSKVCLLSKGISLIASLIIEEVNWTGITAIGGPANGAIPIVSSILTILDDSLLNGFFVGKTAKGYGKKELIEGNLEENDKVLLVEDVTTTGGSLLRAVEEVQKIAQVCQVISVVDRNQGAYKLFEDKGIPFKSLLNISQIL